MMNLLKTIRKATNQANSSSTKTKKKKKLKVPSKKTTAHPSTRVLAPVRPWISWCTLAKVKSKKLTPKAE